MVDLPASLSPPSHRMVVLWLHLSPTGVPVIGVYSYVETRLAAGLLELKGVVVEGAEVKPVGVEPEDVVLDGAVLRGAGLDSVLGVVVLEGGGGSDLNLWSAQGACEAGIS